MLLISYFSVKFDKTVMGISMCAVKDSMSIMAHVLEGGITLLHLYSNSKSHLKKQVKSYLVL